VWTVCFRFPVYFHFSKVKTNRGEDNTATKVFLIEHVHLSMNDFAGLKYVYPSFEDKPKNT
ncbi:hypothetical protein, partial [Veronia pacifica]|uniref:hypothetical protein n=1 Tax=Veronia pacifica TaxID=1080227 RepID=UPI001C2FF297